MISRIRQASDAPKVSEYLHSTYGELGLGMKFEPRALECKSERFKASRILRTLVGEVPGTTVTLHPTSTFSRHAPAKPFDEGKHWGATCGFALSAEPTDTSAPQMNHAYFATFLARPSTKRGLRGCASRRPAYGRA